MSLLFEPLTLRGTTLRNRVLLPPMCQYSATDGVPGDWHLVHLGARAAGGFGLVIAEATAVVPQGRISPQDTGLWDERQVEAWARITRFVADRGARSGVQLAHAGRKASTYRPFGEGDGSVPASAGGWPTVGPSEDPFPGYAAPAAMTADEVRAVPAAFAAAARRADAAGFDVVELHAAHGYLLHEFLSSLSNHRTDAWGGSLENRARLVVETVDAVRDAWPDAKPLLLRVSATDWVEGGLTLDEVAETVRVLADHGVDLVDVSTGGNAPASIPVGPGYQVEHARVIRERSGLPTAAVGLITTAEQAEKVLAEGAADAVLVGRAALQDPSWALRAAHTLGVRLGTLPHTGDAAVVTDDSRTGWPVQYERAAWR
ncbi:NADH:flavin oxidoreductase/NADH oxidase [Cellulomonas marina]|uniref:2,4-dienoyl-CoA reductase n=1 Tax=Cellulomonas marina TaxID=988821 RepID=A0A1I1A4I9_9CELL|nr:NADH:flavin oxidoreductase/NADH oxidase [Cellulomonas marina]GIG29547.1 oxidoreductase [Cellulomonas marina]SFB32879.1 2,4-dienoyl-CoA reductase [Cellulomonas marina]